MAYNGGEEWNLKLPFTVQKANPYGSAQLRLSERDRQLNILYQ